MYLYGGIKMGKLKDYTIQEIKNFTIDNLKEDKSCIKRSRTVYYLNGVVGKERVPYHEKGQVFNDILVDVTVRNWYEVSEYKYKEYLKYKNKKPISNKFNPKEFEEVTDNKKETLNFSGSIVEDLLFFEQQIVEFPTEKVYSDLIKVKEQLLSLAEEYPEEFYELDEYSGLGFAKEKALQFELLIKELKLEIEKLKETKKTFKANQVEINRQKKIDELLLKKQKIEDELKELLGE